MTILLFPFVVLVIGLLCFALSTNPKVAEIGKIAYAVGLFVSVELLARTLRL
jgi:hypothetical protein